MLTESNIAASGPTFRFIDGITRPGPSSSAVSHQDRATNHHPGLVKQAYSVWVMVSPNSRPEKWHLTAYFTYAELPHLPTIDRDPNLRTVIVPPGIYRSAKTRTRSDDGFSSRGGSPLSSRPNSYSLPSISTLQVTPPPPGPPTHVSYGTRLPEDERLIHMLNSRHVR
jgi:Gti1/Pac2 family transcription factor